MFSGKIINAVGLISANSIDYIEKLFNLYESKQTAVLLKSKAQVKSKAQAKQINGINLNSILEPAAKTGWFSPSNPTISSEEIAQVSFTSGTEGEPKAIAISHLALDNTAFRLVEAMGIDQSIKEYIGAPVNFSFGLGRCRAIARVGGKGYLPPNGFDPLEISKMLADNEINAISAVPTLWRVLLDNQKYFEETGTRLKWIEIGSQYMSRDEKLSLKKLFPSAKIIQHYGLTEASRTTFLDISEENNALESVGKPTSNIEVKLNAENKICIKGSHLCSGVVINGVVKSLNNKDGWFETSDFGEIKEGFLYYKGRADDIINCGGIKISPDALEREIRQSLGESSIGFCISKIPDDERGEMPLLAILKVASDKQDVVERFALQELNILGLRLAALPKIVMDEFPATATGKIQRKQITSQFKPPNPTKDNKKRKKASSVSEIFEGMFGTKNMSKDSSFDSLGGDSLNYVKASIQLEEYFGYLPKDWNHLSISTLDTLTITILKTKMSNVETNILLRSMAILAVVMGHSGFTFIGGGTQLLIVLVGYSLARFQSNKFISGEVWSSIYKFSIKIIIPYTLLVISYFFWKSSFSWDQIFMYTNYLPMEGRTPVIFPSWFIQVLLQSLVILGVMFSFKRVRENFRENIWLTSYLILIFFVALRILFPHIYDTNYLNQRVPPIYLASLWLGWVILFSESKNQKLITFVTAVILSFVHLGINALSLWISAGSYLLLFKDNFKLPRVLKVLITRVASATFYIYLFHMIFIHIPSNVFNFNSPLINSFFGVLGSMSIWYIFERPEAQRLLSRISTYICNKKYVTFARFKPK